MLFLLFILMVGAVSAASDTDDTSLSSDVANNQVSHIDTSTIDKTSSNNNDNIMNENKNHEIDEKTKCNNNDKIQSKNEGDTNKLQSTDKTSNTKLSFTDLQTNISNTDNIITLNHDYNYDNSTDTNLKTGILINKKITINGNGHIINGSNTARIFNIANTGDLTLINVTITGGQITIIEENTGGYGGAIRNEGNLTIINTTITENKITSNVKGTDGKGYGYGGAIHNTDGSILTIKDSNITQNQLGEKDHELNEGHGGAIYNAGTLIIENSQLNNNQIYAISQGLGGAIFIIYGIVTISDSNITGNNITATGENSVEYGNGIYWSGTLTISNTLVSNEKNNIYQNNVDLGIDDGVISFLTSQLFDINVLPVFEDDDVIINITNGNGGFDGEVWVNVTNATFNQIVKVNVKNGEGIGTIKLHIGKKYNATINIIKNNKPDKISKEFLVISETSFTALYNNITKSTTGTLTLTHNYTYDNRTDTNFKKGITINNKFTIYGNNHTINGNKEARIFKITENGDLTLDNITLVNGNGQNESGDNDIANVAGAIYGYIGSQIRIINTIFNNNTAIKFGGAIFIENNSHLTTINSIFTNNAATGNNSVGGAITADTANVSIINTVFNNNTANLAGGALYSNLQLSISQSTFNNNSVIENNSVGGAIYVIYANTKITNSNFTNNNAKRGGAIFTYNSTININNTKFTENTATEKGGAIVASNNDLNIINSILQNNNAKGSGIYIVNGTLTTINTKLRNNNVDGENYHITHKDSKLNIGTISDITEGTILTIKITADSSFNDNVTLNINGNNYNVEIINGHGQISIPNLKAGTYNAKVIFHGNDNYTETNIKSNTFKVNSKPANPTPNPNQSKVTTKIIAKQKTFKSKVKVKKYTITIKSGKKAVAKVTVYLTIKGKKYKKTFKVKTNNKGKATFKITKLTRKGKYTATIIYKGNKSYKKATKKVKITIK